MDNSTTKCYYAVKRGKNGLKNCIFLSWEDCRLHVEGHDEAEYSPSFASLEDASAYLDKPSIPPAAAAVEGPLAALVLAASAQRDLSPPPKKKAPPPAAASRKKRKKSSTSSPSKKKARVLPIRKSAASTAAAQQPKPSDPSPSKKKASTSTYASISSSVAAAATVEQSETTSDKAAAEESPRASRAKRRNQDVDDSPKKTAAVEVSAPTNAIEVALPTNESQQHRNNKPTKKWEDCLEQLKAFKAKHGHVRVSKKDPDPEIAFLARWLDKQCFHYRKFQAGNQSCMTEEKIQRLKDVGFEMESIPSSEDRHERLAREKWSAMLGQAKAYKEATGSLTIEENNEEHRELRGWLKNQINEHKRLHDGFVSTMTQEKEEQLRAAGVEFLPTWDELFEQLRQYKEEKGNLFIPKDHPALGKFVIRLRQQYDRYMKDPQKTKLTQDQFTRLTVLGFGQVKTIKKEAEEADNERRWEEMFDKMVAHKEQHGDCDITPKQSSDLARWAKKQRREYANLQEGKPSSLTASRMLRMNNIGFKFDMNKKASIWKAKVDALREFKRENGHVQIPVSHPTLGKFVDRTRQEYKNRQEGKYSTLSDERLKELSELGFVFKAGKTPTVRTQPKTWEERFAELIKYKEEHGDTLVPCSNPVLHTWCSTQRRQYVLLNQNKKSRLNQEKVDKLKEIGFVWSVKEHTKAVAAAQGIVPKSRKRKTTKSSKKAAKSQKTGADAGTVDHDGSATETGKSQENESEKEGEETVEQGKENATKESTADRVDDASDSSVSVSNIDKVDLGELVFSP